MNKNTNTRALVESGLMTALTVVLMLGASYLPLLGIVATFLWPLPIALLYIRHGKKYSLLALVASGLVAALIMGDFIYMVYMVLSFGIAGVILGHCIAHKKPAYLTIVMMAVSIFVGVLIMLKAYDVFLGQDVIAMTMGIFNQSIESAKELYASMNVPKETIDTALNAIDTSKLVMLMPIALAGSSLVMAYITYTIGGKLFKRFSYNVDPVKPFAEWYLPRILVFAVTLVVILSYIAYNAKRGIAESYFNNSYIAFVYMFMVNGLCAVDYFLKKKGLPKVARIIVCVLSAMSGLATILMFVGLIDNALNLRKLDKSRVKRV